MKIARKPRALLPGIVAAALLALLPARAGAHCDSLDGPVVVTAKTALEKGDVTPILKWVRPADEGEIRDAFQKTLAVRGKGAEVKELADRYFFETLVRVHRAGEGAPYTGLKATVAEAGPAVVAADKALETGSVESLVSAVKHHVAEGIETRFRRAAELRKHADENVEKGRQFVAAYVDYVHYVEGIHAAAEKEPEHHGHAAATETAPAKHSH